MVQDGIGTRHHYRIAPSTATITEPPLAANALAHAWSGSPAVLGGLRLRASRDHALCRWHGGRRRPIRALSGRFGLVSRPCERSWGAAVPTADGAGRCLQSLATRWRSAALRGQGDRAPISAGHPTCPWLQAAGRWRGRAFAIRIRDRKNRRIRRPSTTGPPRAVPRAGACRRPRLPSSRCPRRPSAEAGGRFHSSSRILPCDGPTQDPVLLHSA